MSNGRTIAVRRLAAAASVVALLAAFFLFASQGRVASETEGPAASETEGPVASETMSAADTGKPDVTTRLDAGFFIDLLGGAGPQDIDRALDALEEAYDPALIPQIIETAIYTPSRRTERGLFALLEAKTGQSLGPDAQRWYQWLWNEPERISTDYAAFKADLYRRIDPRFDTYFRDRQDTARIRLDEIRWGGVPQDGIPPLRSPQMISAAEATYLDADDIVFGLEIDGDVRAYPRRILAWHEMFTDTIGGIDIAGVYCTLCGTVIPYKTEANGFKHQLGTSGFLYRSNKLMYDAATQSLWNTIKGEPVVGPLAASGIQLEHFPVVTTTWGEWVRRHPTTQVLSLKTGHRRDYGEGVAYAEYFATDRLMFNTPFNDDRLRNKQEVVALRFPGAPNEQLAVDTAYLSRNAIHEDRVGSQRLVILTDVSGANRVYDPEDVSFVDYDRDAALTDSEGVKWTLEEGRLVSRSGRKLDRLPSTRAFWFGWHATYPETRLVQ